MELIVIRYCLHPLMLDTLFGEPQIHHSSWRLLASSCSSSVCRSIDYLGRAMSKQMWKFKQKKRYVQEASLFWKILDLKIMAKDWGFEEADKVCLKHLGTMQASDKLPSTQLTSSRGQDQRDHRQYLGKACVPILMRKWIMLKWRKSQQFQNDARKLTLFGKYHVQAFKRLACLVILFPWSRWIQ